MHSRFVRYPIENGFLDHWLAAGPYAVAVPDAHRHPDDSSKLEVVRQFHETDSGITRLPVERGPLTEGAFRLRDYEGVWTTVHCREDHFVDHTALCPACHYVRSWAYAEVVAHEATAARLVLTSQGPADIWLCGEHVHRQEYFSDRAPRAGHVDIQLRRGANPVLVRFEGLAVGGCPHAMAMRIETPRSSGPAEGLRLRLPTTMEKLIRRNALEQAFQHAYLDRDVYGPGAKVVVHWPDDMPETAITSVRLQSPDGRNYAETHDRGSRGDRAVLTGSVQVPDGRYRVLVMPGPKEYYEGNRRVTRQLDLWVVGGHRFADTPYGSLDERRREALHDAGRRDHGLFGQTARMALDRWSSVNADAIRQAVDAVQRCPDGAEADWVGLLGMLVRFGDHPKFPTAIREALDESARQLAAELADDREPSAALGEHRSLLAATAELLTGQRYPQATFGGQSGEWHRERGQRLALGWMRRRAAFGLESWNSPTVLAGCVAALLHLADLAEAEPVRDMAAALLDKLLFGLALNSYRGVLGAAHGATDAWQVRGGLLQATGGVSRLLWGVGMYNHHVAGTVSLACARRYQAPGLLSRIATEQADQLWARERHMVTGGDDGQTANLVTHRTADGMLCSVQDHAAGTPGGQEHIWQATLGAEAVVFTNHPARAHDHGGQAPGFWAGNAVLPRVAQWKDALIAIHRLPAGDWMGFTHAYFPLHAFDEHALRDGWAFARKGNGYIGLTARYGLSLVTRGYSAYRELRSIGSDNVWFCQLGSASQDGDFAGFQNKLLMSEMSWGNLGLDCRTLRGDRLAFHWEGPFRRDGQAVPLTGFKHYENPYTAVDFPCSRMDVEVGEDVLELDFGRPPA